MEKTVVSSVFDLIELRSFSSLWYWVLMALTWARLTQAPLGIPYDLVEQAPSSSYAAEDLIATTGMQVRRRRSLSVRAQLVQVGVWAFVLTALMGLSFAYGSELALSVLLFAVPIALVQVVSARAARDLDNIGPDLDPLVRRLRRLKRSVQAIALVAVFVSAVIGMYHNLAWAAL